LRVGDTGMAWLFVVNVIYFQQYFNYIVAGSLISRRNHVVDENY
jgi:hypothetical protein